MLLNECKVYDVFQTTAGDIVLLGFFNDFVPYNGLILKNDKNQRWEISGIGWDRIHQLKESVYPENSGIKSIWDCKVKCLDDKYKLEKGAILSFDSYDRK